VGCAIGGSEEQESEWRRVGRAVGEGHNNDRSEACGKLMGLDLHK
jgi:hypothetical protein